MIKTRLTDLFGIQHPIVMGGMTILPSINPIPYDEHRQAICETGVKIVAQAQSVLSDRLSAMKV